MKSLFLLLLLMTVAIGLISCQKTPKNEYKRIKKEILTIQNKVEETEVSAKKATQYLKKLTILEDNIDELEIEIESSLMDSDHEKSLVRKGVNYLMLEDLRTKIDRLKSKIKNEF